MRGASCSERTPSRALLHHLRQRQPGGGGTRVAVSQLLNERPEGGGSEVAERNVHLIHASCRACGRIKPDNHWLPPDRAHGAACLSELFNIEIGVFLAVGARFKPHALTPAQRQLFIGCPRTQQLQQIGLGIRKQAGTDFTVGGEPGAGARPAE